MSDNTTDCSVGPAPNPDVSGIGVRLSFYIQAVLLAVLSARTSSADEITQNLGTLIVTNMAYAVTTLVLGFTNQANQLNLYDALIVLYLLTPSWTAIFFTMPQYNRHKRSEPIVKYLAILQSYLVFACAFAVLTKAASFGSEPQCNSDLVFVIFRPFRVIYAGRNAFLVLLSIVTVLYTALLYSDYSSVINKYFKEGRYNVTARKVLETLRLVKPRLESKNADAEKQEGNGYPSPSANAASTSTSRDKHNRKHRRSRGGSTVSGTGISDNLSSHSPIPSTSPGLSTSSAGVNLASSSDTWSMPQSHLDPSAPLPTRDPTNLNTSNTGRRLSVVSFSQPSPRTTDHPSPLNGHRPPEDPFGSGLFGSMPDTSMYNKPFNLSDTRYKANVNGRLIVNLVLIVLTSTLAILNTELLRKYNHPQSDSGSSEGSWGFGQILPLFLTVLPAYNTVQAFKEHGLGEKRKEGRKVRVKTSKHPRASGASTRSQARRPSVPVSPFNPSTMSPFSAFLSNPAPFTPGSLTNNDRTVTTYPSGAVIQEVADQAMRRQGSASGESQVGPSAVPTRSP